MRFIRNQREKLQDLALSLVLLRACSEGPTIGDRLKVTKLMFLATYGLFERRVKGLSLSFYRYTHGPFTPEVYEVWEELAWIGYLTMQPGASGKLGLSPEGQTAASRITGRLESDPNCAKYLEQVHSISDTWCSASTSKLLQHVYSLKVRPIGSTDIMAIKDVPHNKRLTGILSRQDAADSVQVPTVCLQDMFAACEMARAEVVLPDNLQRDYRGSLSVTRFLRPPKPARSFASIAELRAAGK